MSEREQEAFISQFEAEIDQRTIDMHKTWEANKRNSKKANQEINSMLY